MLINNVFWTPNPSPSYRENRMSGKNLVQMQEFLKYSYLKNYLRYENNFCQEVDIHGGNKIDGALLSVIGQLCPGMSQEQNYELAHFFAY